MSADISTSAICFEMINSKSEPVGFIAYINQPTRKRYYGKKYIKRIHRLVILPDYQGIGLGTKLVTFVAEYLKQQKLECSINTTAKNLIHSLVKSPKWALHSYSSRNEPARFGASIGRVSYTKRVSARIGVRKACFLYKQ